MQTPGSLQGCTFCELCNLSCPRHTSVSLCWVRLQQPAAHSHQGLSLAQVTCWLGSAEVLPHVSLSRRQPPEAAPVCDGPPVRRARNRPWLALIPPSEASMHRHPGTAGVLSSSRVMASKQRTTKMQPLEDSVPASEPGGEKGLSENLCHVTSLIEALESNSYSQVLRPNELRNSCKKF